MGEFRLSVQVRNEDGFVVNPREAPSPWVLTGGTQVAEEVFRMTRVPFARPGVYEFKLMGNHAELQGGTFDLRVLPG